MRFLSSPEMSTSGFILSPDSPNTGGKWLESVVRFTEPGCCRSKAELRTRALSPGGLGTGIEQTAQTPQCEEPGMGVAYRGPSFIASGTGSQEPCILGEGF